MEIHAEIFLTTDSMGSENCKNAGEVKDNFRQGDGGSRIKRLGNTVLVEQKIYFTSEKFNCVRKLKTKWCYLVPILTNGCFWQ